MNTNDAQLYAKERAERATAAIRTGYNLPATIETVVLNAYETGAAAERVAIVAWLRLEAEISNPEYKVIVLALAREIERGDHARSAPAQDGGE